MAMLANVPVPSQLPADAPEWVVGFLARLRDEVALPLFGALDEDNFDELLQDALSCGAALRMRWLTALAEIHPDEAAAMLNAWLRPPPPSALADLQVRARRLLGPERSFQLQRAFALTLTEAVDGVAAVGERWQSPGRGSSRLVELAQVVESAAPQDVLAIAWMMVLYGDVPAPRPVVGDAASAAFLRLTSDRLAALEATFRGEVTVGSVEIEDHIDPRWIKEHPALLQPLFTLAGLALSDEAARRVELISSVDPEEPGSWLAEIRMHVEGEPEAALGRVEERALRSGALGVLADGRGGSIALTAEPVAIE